MDPPRRRHMHLVEPWLAFPQLHARIEREVERALTYQRPVAVVSGLLRRAEDRDEVSHLLRGLELASWIDPRQLAILAPETTVDEAAAMARRIRRMLAHLDLDLGYAVCPMDGSDASALIASATAAAASEVAGAATGARTYHVGGRMVSVTDPARVRLYALAERLAATDQPVLIAGAGHELVATLIHERSRRYARPLVTMRCATIGARIPAAALVHGGTLVLDEIGALAPAAQAHLLYVLELQRVGELDLRVVATTTHDLDQEANAGRIHRGLPCWFAAATLRMPREPATFPAIADEIRALEIRRITEALDASGGNQQRAAQLIGMPRRTFFRKIRQYGLRK